MFDSVFLKLQNIHRFSNQGLNIVDTDADHTIRMQLMALELYKETKAFDIKTATFKILVHDLDEVCMCDIPRDVKYFDDTIYDEIERVSELLMDKVGIDSEIRTFISTSKDETPEGWVVKVLDIIDAFWTLVNQAWSQSKTSIMEQAKTSLGYLQGAISYRPEYVPEKLFTAVARVYEECKRRYNGINSKAYV